MIKSMTGFGKESVELPGRSFSIETRSLNSKQLDITLKIPGILREKELELRNLLAQRLERGKIDLMIIPGNVSGGGTYFINREAAKRYRYELKELQAELDEDEMISLLPLILKMPDVIQSGLEELTDEEWLIIREGIERSIRNVERFREHEGGVLAADIRLRTSIILILLDSIEPHEKKRTIAIRERLLKAMERLNESDPSSESIDKNRFEQELIFYLEKLDITEEKVRLKKHCDYFLETMDEENSPGKKLGFITQEIGREINTIGSKANDADIQRIVVQMKDELEKIKEQLLNIL